MLKKFLDSDSIDKTLQVVIKNVVMIVLYAILIISVIEILGVPMTSVMALIASSGLAIGMSLQGALANFARQVLLEAASSTEGILHDPEPFTRLSAVDDDTYIYTVRVWVDADKYWDLYFDILENCSKALNENGIDDPEERMAVRIVKDE